MNIKFHLPEGIDHDTVGIFDDIESLRLPEEGKKALRYIKDFITERYQILKDDIAQEEIQNKEAHTYMNMRQNGVVRFNAFGYSDDLTNKMENSFETKDWDFLSNKISGLV